MVRKYKSKLKKGKLGTERDGIPVTMDRGLYRTEIKKMLDAPLELLPENPTKEDIRRMKRDRLILRLLWETWARLNELLQVDIEDIDLENRTILLRKTKRKRKREESIREERISSFSNETRILLLEFLEERRKGPLFTTNSGSRLVDRSVRKMVHSYAVRLGIQKILGFDENGKARYLVTPKAFREAGEAYAVMDGMDRETAAMRAGHTIEVQRRNYTKFDAIRARDMVDRHLK